MTTDDRFGPTLSAWLHEEAEHRVPDHLAEVLLRTVATRQRHWWSSPERWLPMQTTLHLAPVPRVAGILALLGLILALALAAVMVGSRARQTAPPFGLASNGSIAYAASDGDVYALDQATGETRVILGGPDRDLWPWFSRDGSQLKIERQTGVAGEIQLVIANADGTGARTVGPPIKEPSSLDWSADGSTIATVGEIGGVHGAYVFRTDSSDPPVRIATPLPVDSVEFRPDGRELIVTARSGDRFGIYGMRPDGSDWREIATSDEEFISEVLSPDGTKVAYMTWRVADPQQAVLHVVDVDTRTITTPVFDGVSTADEAPTWSPDGAWLAFERYRDDLYRLAIAPAGGGHVVETGPSYPFGTNGADKQFSPDGTRLLATYGADQSTWLLDPAGGDGTHLPVTFQSGGSWQRQARH